MRAFALCVLLLIVPLSGGATHHDDETFLGAVHMAYAQDTGPVSIIGVNGGQIDYDGDGGKELDLVIDNPPLAGAVYQSYRVIVDMENDAGDEVASCEFHEPFASGPCVIPPGTTMIYLWGKAGGELWIEAYESS